MSRHWRSACPMASTSRLRSPSLQDDYSLRGVNLVRVASKWSFRTAGDLSWLMTRESVETRRLSRAAIETLGDYRLSPTGDPRRDRGNPRGCHLEGNARRAAGNRLDPSSRTAQDARPAADIWYHGSSSCRSSASRRLGDLPGLGRTRRGRVCWIPGCRRVSRVPSPSDDPVSCVKTKIHWSRAIWIWPWHLRWSLKRTGKADFSGRASGPVLTFASRNRGKQDSERRICSNRRSFATPVPCINACVNALLHAVAGTT